MPAVGTFCRVSCSPDETVFPILPVLLKTHEKEKKKKGLWNVLLFCYTWVELKHSHKRYIDTRKNKSAKTKFCLIHKFPFLLIAPLKLLILRWGRSSLSNLSYFSVFMSSPLWHQEFLLCDTVFLFLWSHLKSTSLGKECRRVGRRGLRTGKQNI